MKLIIDISEDGYKKLKEYFANDDCGLPTDLAIAKGIPLEEQLEKIKSEIIGSCNNIAQEMSDLSYTRKIYVYEQLSEIKGAIDKHISELKGEQNG